MSKNIPQFERGRPGADKFKTVELRLAPKTGQLESV